MVILRAWLYLPTALHRLPSFIASGFLYRATLHLRLACFAGLLRKKRSKPEAFYRRRLAQQRSKKCEASMQLCRPSAAYLGDA
jgi:hypothetical protein